MRLLVVITVLAVLCPQVSGAQERFFNFAEGWVNHYSIEIDDEYLLMGLVGIGGPYEHKFRYNYLDLEGNVIDSVEYLIDSVESTSAWSTTSQLLDMANPDTAYIASYLGNPSIDSAYGAVFRYILSTEQFELITTRAEAFLTQFYCIQVKNDSSLLVAGFYAHENFTGHTRLYEMDMEGNTRWQTTFYGGWPSNTRPDQILVMSNGNIALLLDEYNPVNPALSVAREQAIVVMMDSVGNELWRVSPGDTANYRIWPGGMVELDNGELLVSYTDPYYYDEDGFYQSNSYASTIRFNKYDMDGTLMLTDSIPEISELPPPEIRVSKMVLQENGDLVLSAYIRHGYAMLVKVNSDLDQLWQQIYTPHSYDDNPNQHTHIYHFLETSDGGYLCTGQYWSAADSIYPAGIQTAIALKVDEYGCLEEGCGPTDAVAELATEQGLRVWPNPTTGMFKISFPLGIPPGGQGGFEILDIHGRVVHSRSQLAANSSQLTIDLSAEPSGLYLVRLLTEKEVFTTKIMKQ